MNEFGTYHLADNPKLYEPSRSNNFEFIVTGIDNLLAAGQDENTGSKYFTKGQETVRVSVESSSVPHFSMSVLEVKRGNNTMKLAGVPTFSEAPIVLKDFMGARTKDIILAWQALAYNVRTEKVNRMTKYKKDCTLVEYSPDYEEVIRYWEMKGCWVSEVSEDVFSNESNDIRKVTATIQFDKAIPHLPDEVVEG